jgi:hypothetical protein
MAEPLKTYEITPLVSFYISTGDYTEGTVVDKRTLGSVCDIDYSQALPGQTVATITNNNDGTYSTPVFSYLEEHPQVEKSHHRHG